MIKQVNTNNNHEHVHHNTTHIKDWLLLSLSFVCVVLSYVFFVIDLYPKNTLALLDLSWIAIIFCGFPLFKQCFEDIKSKRITSSVLISIALTASIIMGFLTVFRPALAGHENYFFVAGEIAFLMAVGELIEDITSGKSRSAIKTLITLNPTNAALKNGNGYTKIPVENIQVGDTILVRPDELIPIDGILLSQTASINQATLTGEATPVDLISGEKVYAATKNLLNPIEIQTTTTSNATVLSQTIEYYKNATEKKAPIASIADKLSSKLVPIALLIALLVFFITTGTYNLTEGLGRGMAILVVFCPCALALATPTAISAAIGNASKKGILIKNGHTLETLSKVTAIALDKTGTLTVGKPEVNKVTSLNFTEDQLLFYAASAEKQSEHPIGKAIINHYNKQTVMPDNTQIFSGSGIMAIVEGKKVEITKLSAAVQNIHPELTQMLADFEDAQTLLAVIIDDKAEGIISLKDKIKNNAPQAIQEMKNMGYETILLSGDNEHTSKSVADTLNIDQYHYDLLPVEKAEMVQQIRQNGNIILMAGDGVNDAPAMSQSDVSIAMGAMGSQVAIEAADISLFNDDLSKIPYLFRLSRRCINTIKISIFLSLSINLVTVALSAFGFLNAVWGAFLHNVSSVLVGINSALILTHKDKHKNK